MAKQELVLDGLDCASCAAKIEAEVCRLAGVTSATVDFVSQKLTLETDPGLPAGSLNPIITGTIKRIEPDIKIVFPDKANAGAQDENKKLSLKHDVTRLILGGAVFAVAVLFDFQTWLELALFLTSYAIVGGPVVLKAVTGIARGQVFSEHFLMTIATIGAFFIGEYPEGVAVMLFYLVGELFQDAAVDHSRKSISALMDIRPDYANLKLGEELRKVSPESVTIGDLILVKPGEKIPLDGRVIAGTSLVDTAALTGESLPRELAPGSEALSGFINKNGVLTVEVTKAFGESTVSKILDLVQNASSRKAPTEQFITRFARYYTPAVVFSALALAVIPPLVIPGAMFSDWVYRALVFLVVSCPCALVISIPLGFFGGIGGASKRGILVKGSNYLEALNQVETVVFDKTGTLTKGVFEVVQVTPAAGFTQAQVIEAAAYAEGHSSHPIAQSILKAYGTALDLARIETYEELAGYGVRASLDGKTVLAGSVRLMQEEQISTQAVDANGTVEATGIGTVEATGTVVHVAINKVYTGSLVIADAVKEDSAAAIRGLKALGIKKTVMLTGDSQAVGEHIARQLGVDEVYASLLPADKVEKIEALLATVSVASTGTLGAGKSRGKVVFVGDGINDAPVLARADIGVAMGGLGSDAAIQAADIVIMTDEPSRLVTAIKIARRTRAIVFQNIAFALGVKAIFLALGAAGQASMWEAVFADMGVALIAIFNALRVMNTRSI